MIVVQLGEMNYQKEFDILSEVALSNDHFSRAKMAAAIVYKKKIISIGINSYKTSPFQLRYAKNIYSVYFHAEIAAIKNALRHIDIYDFKYADMLICRMKYFPEKRIYAYGSAKPCDGCLRAIAEFGIRNVWYTGEWRELCKLEKTNIQK